MGKLLANCSIRDPNNKFFLSLNGREIVKAQINTSVSLTLQGESLFKTNGFITPESVSWLYKGCIRQSFLSFVFCHPGCEQCRHQMRR